MPTIKPGIPSGALGGGTGGAFLPGTGITGADLMMPSPSLLFHRDGTRRVGAKGGVVEPFPEKMHRILTELEESNRSDVASFVVPSESNSNQHGFAIHKPDRFFAEVAPQYFRTKRPSSFKRQLNLYGFVPATSQGYRLSAIEGNVYHHNLFRKDDPDLCRRMKRINAAPPMSQSATKKATLATAIGNNKGGTAAGGKNGTTDGGGPKNGDKDASAGVESSSNDKNVKNEVHQEEDGKNAQEAWL